MKSTASFLQNQGDFMKRMIGTLFGIVLVLSLIGCAAESKVVNNSATDSYPFYEQWLKEQAEMKAQQCEV